MEGAKKKKIIFLDIDGVLNSENHFLARYGLIGSSQELNPKHSAGDMIDVTSVGILNYIIKKTDADIVISSSWRCHADDKKGNDELQDILKERGLIKPFIDVTPFTRDRIRGNEIQIWLDNHKDEVENYVIFDDDSDMLDSQQDNFIQTNEWYGLTAKDAFKAIEILGELEK